MPHYFIVVCDNQDHVEAMKETLLLALENAAYHIRERKDGLSKFRILDGMFEHPDLTYDNTVLLDTRETNSED